MQPRRRLLPVALSLALLGGCAQAPAADSPAGESPGTSASGGLEVIAAFYPVEYLAARVLGDHGEVTSLTAPGVDPHDVELTPKVVGRLGTADLVVHASGMQPPVDAAVAQQAQDRSLDVTPAADLLALTDEEAGDDDHADHADDSHGGHADDGHDHGPEDPHFWLDPERYGQVAEAIADRLAAADPAHAEDYRTNAAAVVTDLEALDAELAAGLASCDSRELVTTHEAFGYLAHRYDLHQIGITGLSPESEPSPARLAEVSAQVRELGISTIYAEPILSDGIARTVAAETGARVLTLDPVEGITEASAGSDYLEVMRANLSALRDGLGCS